MRRHLLVLALVLGCEADSDDDGCFTDDEPARVTVQNRTGNTFERITMTSCDLATSQEFPVPPPGILDGDDVTLNLPEPGCWLIDYDGEGCTADPSHRIEQVCSGQTHVWTADPDTHVCVGG